MLLKFANRITFFFVSRNLLEKQYYDWYVYTIQTKMICLIGIASMLVLGSAFWGVLETILFLQSFILLRKCSGGYHASTWWKCWLTSMVLIVTNSFLSNIIYLYSYISMILLICFSISIIFIFAPINHPNMKMNSKELYRNKIKARKNVILGNVFVLFLSFIFPNHDYAVCYVLGLVNATLFVLIAKIIRQEVRK
ncbi:MAG: accessory gene regulator B family protein [Eubacteriales bacterium]